MKTTENPYFEVNGALLSRSNIFELKPLSKDNIKQLVLKAVYDPKGMQAFNACIDDEAAEFLSDMAGGDARSALNAVELGILSTERSEDGKIHITLPVAEECIQKRAIRYDKDGDNHYDIISAFIKSMRGSDPDAAVFYLAKMLYGGESVTFIARRIMICASEDVSKEELLQEKESLKAAYKEYQKMDLSLNMARGKPAVEQLDMVMDILDVLDSKSEMVAENGIDVRNYGEMDGIPEAKN